MIRRPPRSTLSSSSAASDVYKRQLVVQPMVIVIQIQQLRNWRTLDNNGAFICIVRPPMLCIGAKQSERDSRIRKAQHILPRRQIGNGISEQDQSRREHHVQYPDSGTNEIASQYFSQLIAPQSCRCYGWTDRHSSQQCKVCFLDPLEKSTLSLPLFGRKVKCFGIFD